MKQSYKYIGKSIPRSDTPAKSTGEALYVADLKRPGMLFAKLVLSSEPHSKVVIDVDSIKNVPGIVAVYTYDDVPHTAYNSYEWFYGVTSKRDEYILNDEARLVGDKIAVVVAISQELAEWGARHLKIKYTPLKAIISLDEAKVTEGCLADAKQIVAGDVKSGLARADYIFEDTGRTAKIHHAAIEPHGVMTEYDEYGNLVIYSPCQTVFMVRMHTSRVLGIPSNRIRVIKTTMGGSFGGKGQIILEPIAAFITSQLKRPVRLIMSREDVIKGAVSRNAVELEFVTGVDRNGKITGRKIISHVDIGAYYTNGTAIMMALGKKAFRLYDIPDQLYDGHAYYTNTVIGGACRGYGSPQLHSIMEIHMDRIAEKLGLDPCEFRLKNLIEAGMKDPSGATDLGEAHPKECILKGMELFDWERRRREIMSKNTDRYAYGVGMACGTHGNGYKGAFPDFTNVEMELLSDGTVYIRISAHEQGCGTLGTLTQIAAEALDMNPSHIHMIEADTFATPYDAAGTQASRVTFVLGGAIKKAGEALRNKLREVYAALHQVPVDTVVAEDEWVYSTKDDMKYSYGELAVAYEVKCSRNFTVSLEYESPANPGVYAAGFAEVRVDKYTGHVDVLDLLCVHDIGQAVNKTLAEGQVEGGAHMSLGYALCEEIDVYPDGRVGSTNFSKYHIINAPSMPNVRSYFIEIPDEHGPYGAKSVGEMAAVVPAPAVVNAVNHALGTHIMDYPLTPERVIEAWEKVNEKRL